MGFMFGDKIFVQNLFLNESFSVLNFFWTFKWRNNRDLLHQVLPSMMKEYRFKYLFMNHFNTEVFSIFCVNRRMTRGNFSNLNNLKASTLFILI